eukprot:XP_001702757.1 predicted protein [Chlamydomonas reinhardtii]
MAVGGPRLAGSWVLVSNASRDPGDGYCTYTRILLNMQAAGAAGVVLMASPDGDVEVMAPEGETEAAEFGGAANGAGATNGAASGASATHGAWHIARGRRVSSSADAAHAHFHAHARPGAGAGAVSAGEAEEPQPYIPGTMVSYYDGLDLLTLLAAAAARNTSGGVVVEFGTQQIPGAWLVADPEGGLAEAGWAALPLMAHAGWAAWWHVYLGRLREDLRRSNQRGDEVVHVMQKQSIAGPHGASTTALVPRAPAARFSRMQLNLALGCEGARFDAGCPAWDHMVQLFVCCEPTEERQRAACAACPTTLCKFTAQTTPWADGNWTVTLELRLGSGPPAATATDATATAATATAATATAATATAATATSATAASVTAATDAADHATASDRRVMQPEQQLGVMQQEQEQGMERATAGARGSSTRTVAQGTALADARAADRRRRMALAGAASAARALSTISRGSAELRSPSKDAPLRPFSYLPLFGSAPFDSQYNAGRQPAAFPTPPTARAAALVGYVTGHGSEPEAGCAEFCPVSHTLYVNGREVREGAGHLIGGAGAGAAAPNNTLWIKGLGPGGREPRDPPADAGSAYIMMSTGVVWYE